MGRSDENLITGNAGPGVLIEEGIKDTNSRADALNARADSLDTRADQVEEALRGVAGGGAVIPPGLRTTLDGLSRQIAALATAVGTPRTNAPPSASNATGLFRTLERKIEQSDVDSVNTRIASANLATSRLDGRVSEVERLVNGLEDVPAPPQPGDPPGEVNVGDLTRRVNTLEGRVGLTDNAGLYALLAAARLALAGKLDASALANLGDYLTMSEYNALIAGVQAQINSANSSVTSMESNAQTALQRSHAHDEVTVVGNIGTRTGVISPSPRIDYVEITGITYEKVAGAPYVP